MPQPPLNGFAASAALAANEEFESLPDNMTAGTAATTHPAGRTTAGHLDAFINGGSTYIPTLIKQHAEDASAKWWRRNQYLQEPRTRFDDLAEFDQTINAHLDGLREAGEAGVAQASASFEKSIKLRTPDVSADCFVVLALAFLSEDPHLIQSAIEKVADKPGFINALNGAFAWFDNPAVANLVEAKLNSPDPILRHAALRQCHVQSLVDDSALNRALLESPQSSLTVAMPAVANCGRTDLLASVLDILNDAGLPDDIHFGAAQCALMLGERRYSIFALQAISLKETQYAADALKLLCLAMPSYALNEHLQQFENYGTNQSLLIQAFGWSGDPAYVSRLFSLVTDESTGRLAGEAFRQITGFDIEANQALAEPMDRQSQSKSPYPLPDVNQLSQWWQQNHQHYSTRKRYFLGRPLSVGWANYLLECAEQSHRELAALHRMFLKPGTARFPTHAGTHLQLERLSRIQDDQHE